MGESDSKPYNPLEHSIVQAFMTGEKTQQYEATDFHEALLFAIAREIGAVHWNRYQKSWDRWSDDPHIPGIQWRSYAYDCDCPEQHDNFVPRHLENCPLIQPCFSFKGVEFNWYKYPGRGMSVNVDWPPAQWQAWFDECLAKIREFNPKHGATQEYLRPMPKAEHFESARSRILWNTDWDDYRKVMASQMAELASAVAAGDKDKGKDWSRIIDAQTLMAIAVGIAAEKERAIQEDRPRS